MFLPPNPSIDRRDLYMETHGVNAKISQAINVAFEEKASDPISRVVELLSAKKRESLEATVKEQASRISGLEKLNRKLDKENRHLGSELSRVEEQNQDLQKDNHQLTLRVNALQARIAKLEAENNAMYRETMDLSSELEDQTRQVERLKDAWVSKAASFGERRIAHTVFSAWAQLVRKASTLTPSPPSSAPPKAESRPQRCRVLPTTARTGTLVPSRNAAPAMAPMPALPPPALCSTPSGFVDIEAGAAPNAYSRDNSCDELLRSSSNISPRLSVEAGPPKHSPSPASRRHASLEAWSTTASCNTSGSSISPARDSATLTRASTTAAACTTHAAPPAGQPSPSVAHATAAWTSVPDLAAAASPIELPSAPRHQLGAGARLNAMGYQPYKPGGRR
mmetsp:Transcript_48835/g.121141  ORF Transcript_48835/g.121141 Transcript_48835/m.121141 type:complete len:394 (-) Transcript_48835:338-1519(-)